MLGRREIKRVLRTSAALAAATFFFSSCASSELENQPSPESSQSSDAALLLDEAVPATEVADANVFADLESDKDKEVKEAPASTEVAATDEGTPYYNSIGGESLRRVAYTLYSDKKFAGRLLERNPGLKNVKTLDAEQKVFFDLESVKPEPTYLTKDLLNRYTGQLAEKVNQAGTEKGIEKTTVTLNRGETLQELSQRLYGTSRYWTEIYLVNHDKIRNYDRVPSGLTLTVFQRSNVGVAAATAPTSPAKVSMPEPRAKEPTPIAAQPAPIVTAPVEVTTQPEPLVVSQPNPIPETPVVMEKPRAMEPEPVAAPAPSAPAPMAAASSITEPEISSSKALTRPIIYAVLVLLILGAGFYFTRSPKRSKVDMLDIAAADSASRPKLAKDTQKSNIG